MNVKHIARALGWFSIGLGLSEFCAPKTMARATGLEGHETLIRLYGARELAAGIGLLAGTRLKPWILARVGGDVLDGGLLGAGLSRRNPKRGRTVLATIAVAPTVALDLYCAVALGPKD